MEEVNNIIYFESDEEFTDFCIEPYAVIKKSGKGSLYYEGEYSSKYKRCVEERKKFIIKNENSLVYKRQCVSKRVPVIYDGAFVGHDALVQLFVENLEPYFDSF